MHIYTLELSKDRALTSRSYVSVKCVVSLYDDNFIINYELSIAFALVFY